MARTLFTFLGRAVAVAGGGYRETRYALPAASEATTYVAYALIADRLRRGPPYDRAVVLGTSGSMWDDLAVNFGGLPADGPVVTALRAAARDGRFGEGDLAALTRALALRAPLAVDCVLIPDCRVPEEMTAVVGLIAERVAAGDVVDFDVTHGYRHLPLLALAALSLVGASRQATIGAVHYGAYEMKAKHEECAPVLDLKAYLGLVEWSRALAAFDASGDPTAIGRLIEQETGAAVADEIAEAAHRERMLDIDAVRAPWRKARLALAETRGIGALFGKALDARFAWTGQPSLGQRQRALAAQALRQGDALRAALLLFEATITAALEARDASAADLTDRAAREEAQARLRRRSAAFRELSSLRHLLAHPGARDAPEARRLIATPGHMLATLKRLDTALSGERVFRS